MDTLSLESFIILLFILFIVVPVLFVYAVSVIIKHSNKEVVYLLTEIRDILKENKK